MNKNYEAAYKKINKYKLNRKERALVFKQLTDVLDEISEEVNDNEIDGIINDIFELNELDVKEKKYTFKMHQTFWGVLILLTAGLVLLDPFTSDEYIIIYASIFTVYFLINRAILLSLLSIALIIGNLTMISNTKLIIFLVLIYIGVKILIGGKNHGYNPRNVDFKNISSSIDGDEIIFLDNKFGALDHKFDQEEFSYINLCNKFAASDLDFSNYEFSKGDLVLNVDNKCGALSVTVAADTNVKMLVSNKLGSCEVNNTELKSTTTNNIIIQGDNTLGSIEVIYK